MKNQTEEYGNREKTQSSRPLVSVIIPFHREENFLEETLLSVLNQTFQDWEILLIDDASPDDSRTIAERYARSYPEKIFHLFHENYSNRGVCRSRNLGIEQSRGEFIAYLDADDVWTKEKLQNQLKLFAENPEASVILEASVYWYSWNAPQRHDVCIRVGYEQDRIYSPPELVHQLYPLGTGAAPCPSGIIVRRSVHERSLFVEDFIGDTAVYEDQAFLAQLYMKEKIYISSKANNLYRQRRNSQVSTAHDQGRYYEVRRFYLDWFDSYLRQEKVNDNAIQKLLKKNRFLSRFPLLAAITKKLPKFRR